jgi:hypothetical protein
MKRISLTAVASALLVLGVPGVALAHHGKRHQHVRHSRTHRAGQARLLVFGSATGPVAGTPTPSAPTTITPSGETAGTIESFADPVLTIKLNDLSLVSGKVTAQTQIVCRSATPPTTGDDDQGAGDDEGDESDEHAVSARAHAADHSSGDASDEDGSDDQGSGDDEQSAPQSCTKADLVHGATVGEAELSLSSAGAVWEKVEIIK